jgi:hypothetical protein
LKQKRQNPPRKNKELYVVFGGDGRVVGFTKAFSSIQARSGFEHTRGISLGDQAYAKLRSDFGNVDISVGTTEEEIRGLSFGRTRSTRP